MPERSVHVLHVLFPRRVAGETQVLLHEHPRWRESTSDRPLLALPATKLTGHPDAGDPVGPRIRSVLHTDLGLSELAAAAWKPFAEVEARTVSPTHRVLSRYRIAPVLTRLPAIAHGRAVRHVRGRWLSPRAALARPDLSPTARVVLERVNATDLLPQPPAVDLEAGGDRAVGARLSAARDGDLEQFAAVVRELTPVLARRLRRAACTRAIRARSHDIEDVLAVAFTAALENLEQFDPCRGSASGWLWIIARNAAVSLLRRDGRTVPLTPEAAGGVTDGHDPTAPAVAREEYEDLRARLDDALRRATPRMRRAWALRTDEGLKYQEIAKILGAPFGTVVTWVRRIREMAAESPARRETPPAPNAGSDRRRDARPVEPVDDLQPPLRVGVPE